MRNLEYPCCLEDDPEGGFMVNFPDIPEALTAGKDRADALAQATDALSVALTFYLEEGSPIPEPSRPKAGQNMVSPSLQVALKASLHGALRELGKRPADLARALGTDHKSALRILDPDHATRVATLENALAVLGKRVTIMIHDKAA